MATNGVHIDLEELRRALLRAKAEETPKRIPSLREVVCVLIPEIDSLRRAKWSDVQISEWFGKKGMRISAGTLAQYIREARRTLPATSGARESEYRAISKPSERDAEPLASLPTVAKQKAKQKLETRTAQIPSLTSATSIKRSVNDDA
jgi:hypothetical protein